MSTKYSRPSVLVGLTLQHQSCHYQASTWHHNPDTLNKQSKFLDTYPEWKMQGLYSWIKSQIIWTHRLGPLNLWRDKSGDSGWCFQASWTICYTHPLHQCKSLSLHINRTIGYRHHSLCKSGLHWLVYKRSKWSQDSNLWFRIHWIKNKHWSNSWLTYYFLIPWPWHSRTILHFFGNLQLTVSITTYFVLVLLFASIWKVIVKCLLITNYGTKINN